MRVLSTASRVHLLAQLRAGTRTVGELATGAGMTQSAASQQLRVLRHLGLVVRERPGTCTTRSAIDTSPRSSMKPSTTFNTWEPAPATETAQPARCISPTLSSLSLGSLLAPLPQITRPPLI